VRIINVIQRCKKLHTTEVIRHTLKVCIGDENSGFLCFPLDTCGNRNRYDVIREREREREWNLLHENGSIREWQNSHKIQQFQSRVTTRGPCKLQRRLYNTIVSYFELSL